MKTLYRYTPHTNCRYRDEIITQARIWFSKPDDFNDPFDSRLDYRRVYSQDEIRAFWEAFLENNPSHPQTLPEILSLYGDSERFVEQQNRVFAKFRSQIGVACFSATPANILMWSHYANNHKGIVYEFEPSLFSGAISDSFSGHPLRVEYAQDNEYGLLSYALTGKPKQQQFATEQLTKANDWGYEREYRFIDLRQNGNKSFRKESLRTIIFGAKTPQEEINRIQTLCQEHGFEHVKFRKAKLKLGKFEIEIIDV